MEKDLLREFMSYPSLYGKILRHRDSILPQKLTFGEEKDQYILHFAPQKAAKRPVIFYLHGGGWNSGNPLFFRFIGQRFAQEGYHCIMPGYRKTPAFSWPAQEEDVCAAYGRMLSYLKRRKIAADQIIVAGSSAGAHLGALLCYDDELRKYPGLDVDRICGFAGLGGVYYFGGKHSMVLRILMRDLFAGQEKQKGKRKDRNPEENQAAQDEQIWEEVRQAQRKEKQMRGEPYRKLRRGQRIPMLLIHGKGDGVVSYQNAEAFCDRAVELGIPAEFFTAPAGKDSHSVYTAGCFLEERNDCETLERLFGWLEKRSQISHSRPRGI